ncbi:MAG: LamG domain-containing protein [Phycisphaerae bacterium]|nr:LamG domain-containing protein [Phycisphaerae bacterium]
MMRYSEKHNRAKGVALIIILVLVTAITVIGLGFIVRGDTELLFGQNMELKANMDYLSESGLAHGKGMLLAPQDTAGEFWAGANNNQLVSGSSDYYDVTVSRIPAISNLDFQIASKAYRMQNGSKIASNNLTAQVRFDPDIALWLERGAVFYPCMNITGDVHCDGILNNSGTIDGDCFVDSLTGTLPSGAVKNTALLPIGSPEINCTYLTSNFSTSMITGDNLRDKVLTGSEVYYREGDLEIKEKVNISGCLAVNGNLTISGINNQIVNAKNTPAIYVNGNIIIKEGASITTEGLVLAAGRIDAPIFNWSLAVTGLLFVDGGIRWLVPDSSSYFNSGIINGDCGWVNGAIGGAINFDGDNDFIDLGNPAQLNITDKITVTAWIKVNAFDKYYQAIVTKGDSSWRLQRYGGSNYIEFSCSGVFGGSIHGNINVNDGQWHHIAGVYDGSRIYLYVDGVLDYYQSALGKINVNSSSVYVGENYWQRGRYFNGDIDDVRIYKKNLSQSDILKVRNGEFPLNGDLVGRWNMDWGNCTATITAAPLKAAVYNWPGGVKDRWIPAGAIYKSITRN